MSMLMLLLLFSCRDETTETETTINPLEPDTNYEQLVYGQVLTADGNPVGGATVSLKDKMTLTDEMGLFLIENAAIGDKGTQVSAIKEGYLYGGYRLYASNNANSFVEIKLMEDKFSNEFNSNVGGAATLSPNSLVSFEPNSFTANGMDVYTGNVSVSGNWIDPSSEQLLQLTPGDLTGINLDNQRVMLSSLGMLGVELRGDNGEELNLLPGTTAEIKFEVPDELISEAPSTIPLWSFDEIEGVWIEEASAQLVGNQYVGNVSHFSWWNADFINPIVDFCMEVLDNDGNPLEGLSVSVKSLNGFGCATGYTNSLGYLCGTVPENTELEIFINTGNSNCNGPIHSEVVGPYTSNDSPVFEQIIINASNAILTSSFSGVITDCAGNVVPDAIVQFNYDNNTVTTITNANGEYDQEIIHCDPIENLEVYAVSIDLALDGQSNVANVTGGNYMVNVDLCNDFIDSNILFSDPSTTILLSPVVAKVKPFETILVIDDQGQQVLGMDCMGVGSCTGTFLGNLGMLELDITITKFGNIGDSIEGTFMATDVQTNQTYTGSFVSERVE